jgi:hypothetical protein
LSGSGEGWGGQLSGATQQGSLHALKGALGERRAYPVEA